MNTISNPDFWKTLDKLLDESEAVIDRPRGSTHPRFPHIRYDVDYGYLKSTSSMDRCGIDLWLGTATERRINALICTVDLMKRDSEIKLLVGCTEEETQKIYSFHNNSEYMKGILITRGEDQ